MSAPPTRHPEAQDDERCIGNFLPDELPRLEGKYAGIRVGTVPYDHDGTPKADYGGLRPVFVQQAHLQKQVWLARRHGRK